MLKDKDVRWWCRIPVRGCVVVVVKRLRTRSLVVGVGGRAWVVMIVVQAIVCDEGWFMCV